MTPTQTTHGGPRPGAGRKPSPNKQHNIPIRCTSDEWAALEADREARGMSWTAYIMALKSRSDSYGFLEHEDWSESQ